MAPPSHRRQFFYRAFWPVALIATILWGSGTAGPEVPGPISLIPHFDKWVHFFVFGLIATLIYRTLPGWMTRRRAMLLAICLTSLFGFADELRQSFNDSRYADVLDWVADTLGAIVAVTVYTYWPFYRNLLEFTLIPFKKDRDGFQYRRQTNRAFASANRPAR